MNLKVASACERSGRVELQRAAGSETGLESALEAYRGSIHDIECRTSDRVQIAEGGDLAIFSYVLDAAARTPAVLA